MQISLIRLLSTEDGRALDMNAALTQISAVFRVASELSVNEDSLRRRFNQLVSFSVQDAHARRLQLGENNPGSDGPSKIYSRMGSFSMVFLGIMSVQFSDVRFIRSIKLAP